MNKKISKTIIAVLALGALTPGAVAQERFVLKPHAAIGLGKALDMKSTLPMVSEKASSNEFGLDFGYTFWQKGGNSLGVNVGLAYRPTSLKLTAGDMQYQYDAPADADMDGDTYVRYYRQVVEGLEEKISTGYLQVPLYLDYRYRISDRVAVYGNLGVEFGFKCSAKINKIIGTVETYGVYPQYDDLVINESYLNGFGETGVNDAVKGKVNARGFMPSLLVGAGFEFRLYGPLWFDLGVRYNCGFNDMFKHCIDGNAPFTAETAPVTYTVAEGENVRSLTDYMTKSRLSQVQLDLGFSIRF